MRKWCFSWYAFYFILIGVVCILPDVLGVRDDSYRGYATLKWQRLGMGLLVLAIGVYGLVMSRKDVKNKGVEDQNDQGNRSKKTIERDGRQKGDR